MTKVSILTNVYNAESFISETIESVLNQTDPSFKYYLRLNSCTDRSEEIVRSYAEKDSRIVVLKNEVNFVTDDGIPYRKRGYWPALDSEYVAILDHDDFLQPNFVKEMYALAHSSNAEMAICGCAFFDSADHTIIGSRNPPVFSGITPEFLSKNFIPLYSSLRTLWGKVFRTDCFDASYDELFTVPANLETCMDTWFILGFLEKYSNIVSTDKILLLYRKSKTSQYFDNKPPVSRIGEGDILFQKGEQLLKKANAFTSSNHLFLHHVLISHICDLLNMSCNSLVMTDREKLEYFQLTLNNSKLINCRKDFMTRVADLVYNCILPLAKKDDDGSLWDFYLYRLAYLLKYGKGDNDSFIIYWSILTDPENVVLFGLERLASLSWQQISPWVEYWFSYPPEQQILLLHYDPTSLLSRMVELKNADSSFLQKDIINAMNDDDWDTVSQSLTQLDNLSLINETGLFARIMLFLLHGESLVAKRMSAAAVKIFPKSTALQNIYHELIACNL